MVQDTTATPLRSLYEITASASTYTDVAIELPLPKSRKV
jgi:hypothetical protein